MQQDTEQAAAAALEAKEQEAEEKVAELTADYASRVERLERQERESREKLRKKLEEELEDMEADRDEWRAAAEKHQLLAQNLGKAAAVLRVALLSAELRSGVRNKDLREQLDRITGLHAQEKARADAAEQRVGELERTFVVRARRLEDMREGMRDALTESKRKQLMDFRVTSAKLARAVAESEERVQELEDERNMREEELRGAEEAVREAEAGLREVSEQSNVGSDGRVDMAVARRKKNMHTAHQRAVNRLSETRARLRAMHDAVEAAEQERGAREEELKAVERDLLVTLMEQQKGLLAILKAPGEAGFEVGRYEGDDAVPQGTTGVGGGQSGAMSARSHGSTSTGAGLGALHGGSSTGGFAGATASGIQSFAPQGTPGGEGGNPPGGRGGAGAPAASDGFGIAPDHSSHQQPQQPWQAPSLALAGQGGGGASHGGIPRAPNSALPRAGGPAFTPLVGSDGRGGTAGAGQRRDGGSASMPPREVRFSAQGARGGSGIG